MFYNGFYHIVGRMMGLIFLTYLYLNASTGLIWPHLGKLILNDSLLVLYLLASSVSTLWVFTSLVYFAVSHRYRINLLLGLLSFCSSIYLGSCSDGIIFVSDVFKLNSVNINLQNGLVNIHPLIIYYFYVFLILLSVFMLNQIKTKQFYSVSTTKLYLSTLLLLLGVLLGAIWAVQELNWGGLWSWDPVEMISVILALYLVKILHKPAKYIEKSYSIVWLLITGVIILLILRVGVLTTIHSFVKGTTNPAHVKWSMLVIISVCYLLVSRDAIDFIRYNSLYNIPGGTQFYSYILVLMYSYVIYLFVSINTNIWQYITFDTPSLSCSLIAIYCFYRIMIKLTLKLKLWVFILTSLPTLFVIFNYKNSVLVLLILSICISDKFVPRLKILHKYTVLMYLFLFCTMVNLLVQTAPIKFVQNQGLSISTSGFIESLTTKYELFAYLNKQIIITKLKIVSSHIQGFNLYSNGLLTTFSFSKNQNIFYLFNAEYISSLIAYLFILGFSAINYKQTFVATFKTY